MSTSTLDHGCYVADHHGIYVPNAFCSIASAYGWNGHIPTLDDCRDASEDAHHDVDEAIEWMNDNVAEEGSSFGWWEGGIYYFPLTEWEEAF